MYTSFMNNLRDWAKETTDRQKLQHIYLVVAVGLLVIAGVLGLANYDLGQKLLAIAITAAGAFLINAVSWALLQSFVLLRLERTPSKPARKSKK